jgi:hypothetical protein
MDWMMHGGSQNDFDSLLGCQQANPASFFYGSNLSIKKDILGPQPFSKLSSHYGWEDLALGTKLADQGLSLFVLHDAVGLHHHHYSPSQIFRRQLAIGQSLVWFQRKYPHKKIIPPKSILQKAKQIIFHYSGISLILQTMLSFTSQSISTPFLFSLINASQLWHGVRIENRQCRYPQTKQIPQ